MGKIRQLDKKVSELIAAGEVIERPASIVKELLENSIDAHATAITVEVKRGGISFLRITDNGIGIPKEQLALAFSRHATSKVSTVSDLDAITTLGFRGEALASICAVSKVEMLSKPADQPLGARIAIASGEVGSVEDAGCPDGTTLIVRDLFYRVPARLKFLKKDVAEANAVQGIVEKIALSHPEIAVTMIRENKTVLHTPGDGKLLSAIHAVFSSEFANAMLPVTYEYHGIRVTGFVCQPEYAKKTRMMQHFFINHRYVKSQTCTAALTRAYEKSLMVGRFPTCVLHLSMNPADLDVNVHPAKIEVRFHNERPIFETVYFAVKTALQQYDSLELTQRAPQPALVRENPVGESPPQHTPSLGELPSVTRMSVEDYHNKMGTSPPNRPDASIPNTTGSPQFAPVTTSLPASFPVTASSGDDGGTASMEKPPAVEQADFSYLNVASFQKREGESVTPEPPAHQFEEDDECPVKLIGELFATYILFEVDRQFVILDKHAAHERILYETLREELTLKQSQILLAPVRVELSTELLAVPLQHQDTMESFGFAFVMEEKHLCITQIPLLLCGYPIQDIVEDLVKNLAVSPIDCTPQVFDELLHSMACRAALMANQKSTPQELSVLAKRVYYDKKIRHCPHGRPVGFAMTKGEIEKKFGRT